MDRLIALVVLLHVLSTNICTGAITVAGGLGYAYRGTRGPEHWGDMQTEWKECKEGKLQSPIGIRSTRTKVDKQLGSLKAEYNQLTTCSVSTSPYIFKIFVSGARCTLPLNKSVYTLTDFHFHAPSEHTLDGVRYPLELHLVHRLAQNSSKIAVVAKFFTLGEHSPLLHQILERRGQNATIQLSDYLSLHGEYYRYVGSLTTPPCSQGILWTILKKTGSVSGHQISKVVTILQGRNARPLQRINNRVIYRHAS